MNEISSPESLLKLSGNYWATCALHAGVSLGLFTALEDGPLDAQAMGCRAAIDARAGGMLLRALASMGLLNARQDRYALTDFSRRYLGRSSPDYLGHIIMHHHNIMASWTKLPQAVRTGQPVRERASHGGEDRESFLMGMFNLAMAIAPGLAREIDLRGKTRLLDLGGGPGTYACQFCLANPAMTATVFDLPGSEPFARKVAQRFGLADRVDFAGGDFLADPLPGEFDVVWMSQILHAHPPEECALLVEKSARALGPGGLIFIHEFILDDTGQGPTHAALFSLNMLLGTQGGQSYSEAELRDMLEAAGARDVTRLSFCGPNASGVVMGRVD
ncbi:methyltransferase [Fundidesulfovibrio butyratiphilus]